MSIITSGVGRIGKDATTRRTQGGDAVTGFSLAMDEGFGENKKTLWFDCSGWGKRYEAVCPYLLKGGQVFVSGEQGEREHDGKVYKTLRLNDLQLVGGKPQDKPATGNTSSGRGQRAPAATADDGGDDIPFVTNRGTY